MREGLALTPGPLFVLKKCVALVLLYTKFPASRACLAVAS